MTHQSIPHPQETTCDVCGFDLWLPIASLESAHLGLYSDSRFPGRCILSLSHHRDHYEDLPGDEALDFTAAIKNCVQAIKTATGVDRVNVAILGNAESHVHAHLIPRRPESEPRPNSAPWEDTRPKTKLSSDQQDQLIKAIFAALTPIYARSAKYPVMPRRRGVRVPSPDETLEMFSFLNDPADAQ